MGYELSSPLLITGLRDVISIVQDGPWKSSPHLILVPQSLEEAIAPCGLMTVHLSANMVLPHVRLSGFILPSCAVLLGTSPQQDGVLAG